MTASNGALGNSVVVDEGSLGIDPASRLRPSKSVSDDLACMREPAMTLPNVHRTQTVEWRTTYLEHARGSS